MLPITNILAYFFEFSINEVITKTIISNFVFQIWLIFTGVVSNPFEFGWFHKADMYGNEIWLPSLSACSLLFSSLSMMKTVIFLNIMRIHVKVFIILSKIDLDNTDLNYK